MIRRTPSGKAKNGMTSSQLRRQLCAIAGYFCAPGAVREGLERGLAGFGIGGAIDRPQRLRDGLAILPGGKLQRMADQVNDAGLNDRLRENGIDRLGEALQAIDDGDQNVLTPRFFSSFMTRSQNLAPSVCSIQMPRISLVPSGRMPSAM